MGVDIHMNIITKDGGFRYSDIYDGRNSEWFDNISHKVINESYRNFPHEYGLPELIPEDIKHDYEHREEGYYDFYYVKVEDFIKWYITMRPDLDAGWVSTYDQWLYQRKGIVPEVMHWLDKEYNPNDYHFIEVENPWESSSWLHEFVTSHEDIRPDDYIVYYFDC